MVVGDISVTRAQRLPRMAMPPIGSMLPLLVTAAVVAGALMLSVGAPIAARGDYGQWLMTSRYYLGAEIPDYRNITALPPAVPLLMAAVRLVISNPIVALHLVSALLLAGVAIGFYAASSWITGNRWVGAFSVVGALLVTDRFLELFAFGGLLQAASVICMCLSVGAFARAGQEWRVSHRWWLCGAAAMSLAALTHVGTGAIAVPVGISAALLSASRLQHLGRWPVVRALVPSIVLLTGVAIYWLVVLVPASDEYLTNPASLAYRGPGRLFDVLFSYPPTSFIVGLGAIWVMVGAARDLLRLRIGGAAYVAAWAGITWGALGYSIASSGATDYPRFATVLLAPLIVAAAAAIVSVIGTLENLHAARDRRIGGSAIAGVVLFLGTLLAAPLTVGRFERQVSIYQPRDAESLTAAVTWLDGQLSSGETVLTDVREGKWLEGLTGRAALFSQPVRYAFRPGEWQRSADADALLRSSAALSSGYISGVFTSESGDAAAVPTGLLIRANHGGEFVDLLRLSPATTMVSATGEQLGMGQFVPLRTRERSLERQASITTVWGRSTDPGMTFTQRVITYRNGTTLRVSQSANARALTTDLIPAGGQRFASVKMNGSEAIVCFPAVGGATPCLNVDAAPLGAALSMTADGVLRATSGDAGRLDLLITATTAGQAPIDLGIFDPSEIATAYRVGAALLYQPDPAFRSRVERLEALGFHQARAFGPYRVLMRGAEGGR